MTLPTEPGPGVVEPPGDRCPACDASVADSWLACAHCGARLAVAAELPAGTTLNDGRFAIRRVLGRGGFGITYEADDTRLHRRVALKELFPDAAVRHGSLVLTPPEGREPFREARERFLREARVLARFNDPGIVRVFEVFEEHGTAYLVLELLDGQTLADVLRQRGRPFAEHAALDVARRVGGALSAIHGAGLLHRDVSPSNLVVTGSGRIVLIDFGLARSFDAGHTAVMTRIVTPGYAPPEQYLGSARFGPPTDVYGLAATLYRLLTGTTLPSAIDRQHGTELPPPRRVNPAVSKLVSDAILDGLELNPDHRPPTVDAFLARLGIDRTPRPVGPAPVTAHEKPAPEPAPPRAPVHVAAPIVPVTFAPVAAAPVPRVDAAAYLPGPIVGPPRKGRWVASTPLAIASVGLMAAAPILIAALLVLVLMPLLATAGDLALHRSRRTWGGAATWFQRRSAPAAAVPRFLRNAAWCLMRSAPAVVLLAVLVGAWFPIMHSGRVPAFADWFLRLSGVAVGLLLVLPTLRGTDRFASGVAVDALHLRIAPPGQRVTQAGIALWVACVAVAGAAVLFTPEVWPLAS